MPDTKQDEEVSGLTADNQKFIITDDGAIVDPESGEVLGYQNAPLISDDPVPDDVDPLVVKRQEKELVEFYVERRARALRENRDRGRNEPPNLGDPRAVRDHGEGTGSESRLPRSLLRRRGR